MIYTEIHPEVASPRNNARLRLVGGTEAAAQKPQRDSSSTASLDDASLVSLARDGHASAFEALYRRHAAFALNVAVRIQGNASDVEDVVHDAFLRAHQRLAELREPALFRSWLGSIVVRFVRSRMRRRRLLTSLGIASVEPVDLDSIAAPDASPEIRAQLAQVYALLNTLPADDRIAWTLRYIERHRLEVVADLAGCSLATVKRRIVRAQAFLASHFVPPFAEDSP
ncbi:MAG: sigma-70 family RNA polymerase sigma factor [Myxococcales bacterium]|nr:sigma-70 family RNA polymerase sigma factor [Myxococcales bacterium]